MTTAQALQILDLSVPITRAALKNAYREALMVWHPDRFEGNKDLRAKAESKTYQINEAYAFLKAVPEFGYPFQTKAGSQEPRGMHPPPTREPSPSSPPTRGASPTPQNSTSTSGPSHTEATNVWLGAAFLVVLLIALVVKDQSPRKDVHPANFHTLNVDTSSPLAELAANAPIVEIRSRAELGEEEAQYRLGVAYHTGEGVLKDDVEAVRWYRLAAEQGHAQAQNSLGLCYHKGDGVAKDDVEAVKWYRKAAGQGHAWAQNNLGIRYHEGKGVLKDDVEAVKWFRKAADQGHGWAQNNLGVQCHEGKGVLKDTVEAAKWYILAAAQQNKASEKSLAGIVKEMTREQLAEAHRRADEFKRQHVDVSKPAEISNDNTAAPRMRTEEQLRHLPTDGRLNSGSVLADHLQFGGKGKLTLDNGLAEDAFVKMISNEKLMASFYVRGGERFTFDHVPDGHYKLIYCTGFGWDAIRRDFARGRHAVRYDEALIYATTRRNEGASIVTSTGVITLTLHKVANGNTKTTGIPLAEFDRY